MPSDYFAPETPMGASRHAIPKLDVDRKAGTVQVWGGSKEVKVGGGAGRGGSL